MHRIAMVLALVVTTAACNESRPGTRPDILAGHRQPDTTGLRCASVGDAGECTLWAPSLIELIVRPEDYDGKRVRVIGFANFEFEGNGLYVSEEDWKHRIFRNGVWLDPPPGTVSESAPSPALPNRRYVIVEGTFSARDKGHMGMWSGAIEGVIRLDPWY